MIPTQIIELLNLDWSPRKVEKHGNHLNVNNFDDDDDDDDGDELFCRVGDRRKYIDLFPARTIFRSKWTNVKSTYVSEGKQCWFYGKFCVRTKSMPFLWFSPHPSPLTNFRLMFSVYTPWKYEKTSGFPTFSVGNEREHWFKKG